LVAGIAEYFTTYYESGSPPAAEKEKLLSQSGCPETDFCKVPAGAGHPAKPKYFSFNVFTLRVTGTDPAPFAGEGRLESVLPKIHFFLRKGRMARTLHFPCKKIIYRTIATS
jgi:hypothetical protein